MSGAAAQLPRLHPRRPALRRARGSSLALDADGEDELMAGYDRLDAFPENRAVLEALQRRGVRAGILSNGDPDMLAAVRRATPASPTCSTRC